MQKMKKNVDDNVVMQNKTYSIKLFKCTINSVATNNYYAIFEMYEFITPCNVHLDNDSIVKAIKMKFVIMRKYLKDKINHIHSQRRVFYPFYICLFEDVVVCIEIPKTY